MDKIDVNYIINIPKKFIYTDLIDDEIIDIAKKLSNEYKKEYEELIEIFDDYCKESNLNFEEAKEVTALFLEYLAIENTYLKQQKNPEKNKKYLIETFDLVKKHIPKLTGKEYYVRIW